MRETSQDVRERAEGEGKLRVTRIDMDNWSASLRLTKPALRSAFRGVIPDEILARPKEGFGESWNGHEQLTPALSFFFNLASQRLEAAGIPISKSTGCLTDRQSAESLDLVWHNIYLGIWFESATATKAKRAGDLLSEPLAKTAL